MRAKGRCATAHVDTLEPNGSSTRARNQPLEHGVEIGLLLCADAVAADFAVRNGSEVERLNQVVDRELVREIGLVSQDQERDALEGWLLEEKSQLLAGDGKGVSICRIYDEPRGMSR